MAPSQGGLPMRLGIQLTGGCTRTGGRFGQQSCHRRAIRWSGYQEPVIKSVLSVPLELKGSLIGIINLFNKISGDFTQRMRAAVAIIGAQCSQVIENAASTPRK